MIAKRNFHLSIIKQTKLVTKYANVRLPCHLNDGQCRAGETVFHWKMPESEYCPLMVAREFSGMLTTSRQLSEKVLMSTDKTNVRFVLGPSVSKCGRMVITTSYGEVYLYPVMSRKGTLKSDLFTRQVAPGQAKLRLYISNRDDFVYNKLKNALRQEFIEVWQDSCQQQLRNFKISHFNTRTNNGIHSFNIGGNNFLTTSSATFA